MKIFDFVVSFIFDEFKILIEIFRFEIYSNSGSTPSTLFGVISDILEMIKFKVSSKICGLLKVVIRLAEGGVKMGA